MRVVGNKLAVGLLGGALSVLPIGKAVSAKAAVVAEKNVHSSTLVNSVGKHLKGLSSDTYDASEKFMTAPAKASMKVAKEAKMFGYVDEVLKGFGAKEVGRTNKATIYDVPREAAIKLENRAARVFVEAYGDEFEKVRVAVPNNSIDLKDCSIRLTLRKEVSRNEVGKYEETSMFFAKGEEEPLTVEIRKYRTDAGFEFTQAGYFRVSLSKENPGKALKKGVIKTSYVDDNGQNKIDYRILDSVAGNTNTDKATFDKIMTVLGKSFEGLMP